MTLLRTSEAAAYLGVQKSTLEAWRCRGGGPAFIKYKSTAGKGGAVRYPRDILDKFIQANIQANTSTVAGDPK